MHVILIEIEGTKMDLINKAKNGAKKVKEELGVPLPISSNMLKAIIQKSDRVKEINVRIAKGLIIITGKAEVEKMFVKSEITFLISLYPIKMEGREILFEIKKFKPLNLNFLNNIIFNHPPHLEYHDGIIKIDFNSWDKVQMVPIGNIKKYELSKGKVIVWIGI